MFGQSLQLATCFVLGPAVEKVHLGNCILLVYGIRYHLVCPVACLHKPQLNHTLGFLPTLTALLWAHLSQNGMSEYPYKVRELIKELAFAHCCNS